MSDTPDTYTAFIGGKRIAAGTLAETAAGVRAAMDGDATAMALIFEDATGRAVDVDLRGTAEEVRARLTPAEAPRGPGRPRLGVTAREVTLLPRHWDWLAGQPGGASAALRRLVEEARRTHADRDGWRQAKERAYRFMSAIAGGFEGFEEASRALFAHDAEAFARCIAGWPADVQAHLAWLARDVPTSRTDIAPCGRLPIGECPMSRR